MNDTKGFSKIFNEINCPSCRTKLNYKNIKIIRSEDDGITIIQVSCSNCAKSFAFGIFGLSVSEIQAMLEEKPEKKPITYDDILDFHNLMPSFEKNLSNYIKERELN